MVQAAPQVDFYASYNGDFDAGTWSEYFVGGGEGQPGNTITAKGIGWEIDGILESVSGSNPYTTIYQPDGLGLVLDNLGPWSNDPDPYYITLGPITNTTTKYYDSSMLTGIEFLISASGTFDDYSGYTVAIQGYYKGMPGFGTDHMYGNLNWATIEITNTIPAPGALILGSLGSALVAWLRRR